MHMHRLVWMVRGWGRDPSFGDVFATHVGIVTFLFPAHICIRHIKGNVECDSCAVSHYVMQSCSQACRHGNVL